MSDEDKLTGANIAYLEGEAVARQVQFEHAVADVQRRFSDWRHLHSVGTAHDHPFTGGGHAHRDSLDRGVTLTYMKRNCSECGKELDAKRRDALTCSARCRVARSRRLEQVREVSAMYSWETASIVVGFPRKRTEATAMAEAVRLHSKNSNWKWRAVGAELRDEGIPRRRGHARPAQPTGKFWIVKLERER